MVEKENNSMNDVRHPTEPTPSKPTHSPPFVSIGNKERALLQYLLNLGNSRFNVKAYHRISKLPRTTVYEVLNRLISNELIVKPYAANYKITEQGKVALEVSEGGVGSVRRECRKSANLSTHYLRFTIPIIDRTKFNQERLKDLGALDIKPRKLQSQEYWDIYFSDGTIRLFSKSIVIRIHDMIGLDTEEANFNGLNKASDYLKKLNAIGILGDSIHLEPSHYARMESLFAEALMKVDDRYFLDIGEGKKFWIDNSAPNKNGPEDEVNDAQARERLDDFLRDMWKSDCKISDISKMQKAIQSMIGLEIINHKKTSRIENVLEQSAKLHKGAFTDIRGIAGALKIAFQIEQIDDGKSKKLGDYIG